MQPAVHDVDVGCVENSHTCVYWATIMQLRSHNFVEVGNIYLIRAVDVSGHKLEYSTKSCGKYCSLGGLRKKGEIEAVAIAFYQIIRTGWVPYE